MKKFLGYALVCVPLIGLYLLSGVMNGFVITSLIVILLIVAKGVDLVVESEMEK
jgi:hypothetical protein